MFKCAFAHMIVVLLGCITFISIILFSVSYLTLNIMNTHWKVYYFPLRILLSQNINCKVLQIILFEKLCHLEL